MAANKSVLPDNVPPDIPYKFHQNTKCKAVVCILCDSVYYKSDSVRGKGHRFLTKLLGICNDHAHVNITSQSDDARIIIASLLQQNTQYSSAYTQLEKEYKTLKVKYTDMSSKLEEVNKELSEEPEVMRELPLEKGITQVTCRNHELDAETETLSEKDELSQQLNSGLKENNTLLEEKTILLKGNLNTQ
ncbi:hypothetical protein QAD02_021216 [Eretmocerus hayati]|uniref:Uncharacterized protein n=1 Tax=Eretmocerus hayati TaxID=131215 RepID=A0ACC2PQY1_9HYME|nr:hypothetical protein QAD02_021216 [Eretmocerus hayati]